MFYSLVTVSDDVHIGERRIGGTGFSIFTCKSHDCDASTVSKCLKILENNLC